MKRHPNCRTALRQLRSDRACSAALEHLEPRALFNADLGVAFDSANFQLPTTIVPLDRVLAPILVSNSGPLVANGAVTINFYLSSDTTLNTATDRLLRSYPDQPLQLPVDTGDPANLGMFTGDLTIPADVDPGTYFLIVRILPNAAIGDFNQSNNIAATDNSAVLARRFGDFDGRTSIGMTLLDPEGTQVTFYMQNGGYGEVVPSANGFAVTLYNTGNNSQASVSTTGGDGKFDFVSIAINGSVGAFYAPNGRLTGALTATTGFGTMTLGDVLGPTTISVPNTSNSPSFTFGNVSNLVIDSAVGVTSVSATTWLDTDATTDRVSAPWLGSLSISGNTNVSLYLTGRSDGAATLGAVNIGGVVKGGSWSVNGLGTTVTLGASTALFSATFNQRIDSLNTTTGTFRGVFTARSFGAINIGRDILASTIIAGPYLGADGRLGGTGANADVYRQGSMGAVYVAHNVANSIVAAGLDPVDGVFGDGDDQFIGGTTARITSITVANIAGLTAKFLSAKYAGAVTLGGVGVNWRPDSRFVLPTTPPTAALGTVTVSDVGATFVVLFTSTNIMKLAPIHTGTILVTGPGGFEQLAVMVGVPVFTGNGKGAMATFTFQSPGVAWVPADDGDYAISLEPGILKDDRLNIAPGGQFGTVAVSV